MNGSLVSRITLFGVAIATLCAACSSSPKRRIGESCTRDSECASSRCDELVCKASSPGKEGDPCSHALECLSENCQVTTAGGTCAPGTRENGSPCTEDEQCQSGVCDAGTCGSASSDGGVDGSGPQTICEPYGPPTETPPATAGDTRFVRPPFSEESFCVTDAADPVQSWGDTICQRDLGAAYAWGWDGAGTTEALEGAKDALGGDPSAKVLLIPPPYQAATSFEVYGTDCSYEPSWHCGGVTFYPGDCVPPATHRGKLFCTKRSQGPLTLGITGLAGPFDAAYDATNDRYVVAYVTADGVNLMALDAYGQSTLAPLTIYRFTGGDSTILPATPRASVGQNASGQSRVLVVWQQAIGAAQRKRFATLSGDLGVVTPPVDFVAQDGYGTDGQHAVGFDADHRRFLVVIGATPAGQGSAAQIMGRFFDAEGQALAGYFAVSSTSPSGFRGDRIEIAYHQGAGSYLVLDGQEGLLFPWESGAPSHIRDYSTYGASILGVAAHSDGPGYRAVIDRDGAPSTVELDATGAWGKEHTLGTQMIGGPLRVAYLPQASPGTIKGKYLVQNGHYHLWLNDDGTTCFPTLERAVIGGSNNGLLVPNTDTGGFAYLYEEGGALYAKFYLSNGDEF